MFHFDYVTKRGGAVFENMNDGGMVVLNGQKKFSFEEFLNAFILIENYRHPFTITTTAKRIKRMDKQLEKLGYASVSLKQIDFDFDEENAFTNGYYHIGLRNPFREMNNSTKKKYSIWIDDETDDDGTYDVEVYEDFYDEDGHCTDSECDNELSVGHVGSLSEAEDLIKLIISNSPRIEFRRLEMQIKRSK